MSSSLVDGFSHRRSAGTSVEVHPPRQRVGALMSAQDFGLTEKRPALETAVPSTEELRDR
jgi:hypothetical protein